MTIKEKTAEIWEHKVDINVSIVNIVIIVHFVKTSIGNLLLSGIQKKLLGFFTRQFKWYVNK